MLQMMAATSAIKGVGGGKVLSLSFSSIFTYVVELSFLVSKSAHLSPNSRRFRFYRHLKVGRRSEKWPKNRTKIQCFDQDFEKNDLQIATPPSPFDRFT